MFCRKMEKARPVGEEMDGRVVYFPPESALLPLMLYFSTVLFPICTSPSTSFGKQERNRSTSQFQFRSENKTPLRQLRQTKFCWHFSG